MKTPEANVDQWKDTADEILRLLRSKGSPAEALTVLAMVLPLIYHSSTLVSDPPFDEFLATFTAICLKHHDRAIQKSMN